MPKSNAGVIATTGLVARPPRPFVAGGDLTGTPTLQTVTGIQNVPVAAVTPAVDQVLKYTGAEWLPQAESGGGGGLPAGENPYDYLREVPVRVAPVWDTAGFGTDWPSTVVFDGNFLWADDSGTPYIYKISPVDRAIVGYATLPGGATSTYYKCLAVDGPVPGNHLIVSASDGRVYLFDNFTLTIVGICDFIAAGGANINGVATIPGSDHILVTGDDGSINGVIATFSKSAVLAGYPSAVAPALSTSQTNLFFGKPISGGGFFWIIQNSNFTGYYSVCKISPGNVTFADIYTDTVKTYRDIVYGFGSVWAATRTTGALAQLVRLDASGALFPTNTVTLPDGFGNVGGSRPGTDPSAIAVDGTTVWVVDTDRENNIWRVSTGAGTEAVVAHFLSEEAITYFNGLAWDGATHMWAAVKPIDASNGLIPSGLLRISTAPGAERVEELFNYSKIDLQWNHGDSSIRYVGVGRTLGNDDRHVVLSKNLEDSSEGGIVYLPPSPRLGQRHTVLAAKYQFGKYYPRSFSLHGNGHLIDADTVVPIDIRPNSAHPYDPSVPFASITVTWTGVIWTVDSNTSAMLLGDVGGTRTSSRVEHIGPASAILYGETAPSEMKIGDGLGFAVGSGPQFIGPDPTVIFRQGARDFVFYYPGSGFSSFTIPAPYGWACCQSPLPSADGGNTYYVGNANTGHILEVVAGSNFTGSFQQVTAVFNTVRNHVNAMVTVPLPSGATQIVFDGGGLCILDVGPPNSSMQRGRVTYLDTNRRYGSGFIWPGNEPITGANNSAYPLYGSTGDFIDKIDPVTGAQLNRIAVPFGSTFGYMGTFVPTGAGAPPPGFIIVLDFVNQRLYRYSTATDTFDGTNIDLSPYGMSTGIAWDGFNLVLVNGAGTQLVIITGAHQPGIGLAGTFALPTGCVATSVVNSTVAHQFLVSDSGRDKIITLNSIGDGGGLSFASEEDAGGVLAAVKNPLVFDDSVPAARSNIRSTATGFSPIDNTKTGIVNISIAGGETGVIADYGFIIGGISNAVKSAQAGILGGNNNTIYAGSDQSIILGGNNNNIGSNKIAACAGGRGSAAGSYAFAYGQFANAQGDESAAFCGSLFSRTYANSDNSFAHGGGASTSVYGEYAHGSENINLGITHQYRRIQLHAHSISGSTDTFVSGHVSGTEEISVVASARFSYTFRITINATRVASDAAAGNATWIRTVLAHVAADNATLTIDSVNSDVTILNGQTWSISITGNASSQIHITFTGTAGQTIRANALVEVWEARPFPG
jgi:hypothetical protein